MAEGLKLQERPAGSPEQLKVTAKLKPLLAVTVTVEVAALDFVSLPFEGLRLRLKSGPVIVIVWAEELELPRVESPP